MSSFSTTEVRDGWYVVDFEYLHPRSIPRFGKLRVVTSGYRLIYGTLHLLKGYGHDGCSGPARTNKASKRGCGVHDALYGAIRRAIESGLISTRKEWEYLRKGADDEMRWTHKQDGMSAIRRWYFYQAVRLFGENAMLGEWKSKAQKIAARVCAPHIYRKVEACAQYS